MRPEDRTDYIVRCLMEAATMYEDGARSFLAEHDAGVLIEAADALSVWPGDQTPEEERPGYDGPTIDAADRLDDALRPMPWEDRARLIGEHREMVVGELVAELRRMAAAGQASAPQRCPSCDHEAKYHAADDGRCWFTVAHGVPGSNLVCPCAQTENTGAES